MYTWFDKIIVRNPAFPISFLAKMLTDDKRELEVWMKDPFFQEAIYLASPVLYGEMMKMVENNYTIEDKKLRISLYKYMTRMCSRATPFGLFASCSIGEIQDTTCFQVEKDLRKMTRLDMYFLCSLSKYISDIPSIKYALKYYVNDTIYEINNKYRYVEYKYLNETTLHSLVKINTNELLDYILEKASNGISYPDLENDLLKNTDSSSPEIKEYLTYLIDNQILIPEIEPRVTGSDYFRHLLDAVVKNGTHAELIEKLTCIDTDLSKLNDVKSTTNRVELYDNIINNINQLDIQYDRKYIFQVDSFRDNTSFTLDKEELDVIWEGLTILNKLSTSIAHENNLDLFKKKFIEKYDRRKVPLLEVLDPEIGLGYPIGKHGEKYELIDDLILPNANPINKRSISNERVYKLLLEKIRDRKKDTLELVLDLKELDGFRESWTDFPPTFTCMCNLIQTDKDVIINIGSAGGGSSGLNMVARFAYGHPGIYRFTEDVCEFEKEYYPGEIMAEIAHLPNARMGNILFRPYLRKYEINYLSFSDPEHISKLSLNDLFVEVKNNTVYLYSQKLKKYVVPRMTTAHNFTLSDIPLYRFLCEMQTEKKRRNLFFNWETLDRLDFLPRIRYKNVILSLACWNIHSSTMAHFYKLKESELLQEVKIWREKIHIPRYVDLHEGRDPLLVDLENLQSIRVFLDIIKQRFLFQLKESLLNLSNQKEDFHLNEVLVLFKRK